MITQVASECRIPLSHKGDSPLRRILWSYVSKKTNQQWLWHAIDRQTGQVLAYTFGQRKDEVFLKLKQLLEPFSIKKYCTDGWGTYERLYLQINMK